MSAAERATYELFNRLTHQVLRILVNGYVDEMAYEAGTLDRSLPFAELKRRSLINERAKAAGNGADFSARIRQGLPGFARVETASATRDLSLTRDGQK